MHKLLRFCFAALTLLLISGLSMAQTQPGSAPLRLLQSNAHYDSSVIRNILLQNPARARPGRQIISAYSNQKTIPSNKSGEDFLSATNEEKKVRLNGATQPLGVVRC